MSMSSDGKVVQTELNHEEYDRIRRLADEQDLSLKELLRRAALEYTENHSELEPDDPLFSYEPEGTTDRTVTARDTDEYLYGDK